jgi:ankyrin repeat protein
MTTREQIQTAVILCGEQERHVEIIQLTLSEYPEDWQMRALRWCQQAIPQLQQNAIKLDGMLEQMDDGIIITEPLPEPPVEYRRLLTFERLKNNLVDTTELFTRTRDVDVIDLLLFDPKLNPSTFIYVFLWASKNGHLAIVERFLQDTHVDPSADHNKAICNACENGHLAIVERLLQDPRVDPSDTEGIWTATNHAIRLACKNSHLAIVERLLQDPRVDPSDIGNICLRIASSNGHLDLVNLLLQDPRVDPCAGDNYSIIIASKKGHIDIVNRLLQYPQIDPSAYDNEAIAAASSAGHLDVVNRLLQDTRVDPFATRCRALRYAIMSNNLHVVTRLLQDPRFKYDDYMYEVLSTACEYGHLEIVNLLLEYPNITSYNFALCDSLIHNHIHLVNRLLQDSRVDPVVILKTNPNILEKNKNAAIERLLQDLRVFSFMCAKLLTN